MAATARMILQVDPAEKARWTAEARKAGISTSEFVRRRAALDDELIITPEEAEALKWATAELHAAAARMARNLDAMSASLAEFRDPNRHEKLRAQVRAELEMSGERLDLDKLRMLFRSQPVAA